MRDPTRIGLDVDPTRRLMRGVTVHGNIHFEVPFISQIVSNLWQGGCENGMVLPKTFKHLVSLYPWESYIFDGPLTSRLLVEMYDSDDQAFDQVDAIARWVVGCVKDGPTIVNCQAGLNRSALVTGRALTMMGRTGPQAIKLMREKRSSACLCNKSFEGWLRTKRASGSWWA